MSESKNLIHVIDVESTCWEEGKIPNGQVSDIIEIGITVVDQGKKLSIVSSTSYLIKPASSTVSDFCTSINGWTQAKVNKGTSFKTAVDHIAKTLQTKNRPWASFGAYDSNILHTQCQLYEADFPFGNQHLNIKQMGNSFSGKLKRMELSEMLAAVGLKFEGTPHKGGDDAYNAARLFILFAQHSRTLYL